MKIEPIVTFIAVLVRYAIVAFGAYVVKKGFADQASTTTFINWLTAHASGIAGAVVVLGTALYEYALHQASAYHLQVSKGDVAVLQDKNNRLVAAGQTILQHAESGLLTQIPIISNPPVNQVIEQPINPKV